MNNGDGVGAREGREESGIATADARKEKLRGNYGRDCRNDLRFIRHPGILDSILPEMQLYTLLYYNVIYIYVYWMYL